MGYAEDVGNAYVESIEYPNGLFVDYYTELTPLYTRELREVTAETFPQFRKKWGDFLPEMQPDVKFEDLRHAIDTKPDEVEFNLMNYLLPITLLRINMKAKHYGVSEGLVIIQMANAKFMEKRAPEKEPMSKWAKQSLQKRRLYAKKIHKKPHQRHLHRRTVRPNQVERMDGKQTWRDYIYYVGREHEGSCHGHIARGEH